MIWINDQFKDYAKFTINFVVVENFYKSGLLNDDYSIIAQDAKMIGSGGEGYLHEICHSAPQPQVEGNYLWIKEGFTNYLAMTYLEQKKGETEFWKKQKRKYLHYFNLYEESLLSLTSNAISTYWAAYQKGPWVYRMLRSVIGEDNFKNTLIEFGKMKGQKLKNNREYFEIFERVSGQDLSWFENQWINWKENPVLLVRDSIETTEGNSSVRITVTQEGKIFKLPLEIEMQTEKMIIKKTIWIDSEKNEFIIPVKSKVISLQYDPHARLFAIIKTANKIFLGRNKIKLPEKDVVYKYKSDKNDKVTEFIVKSNREELNVFKKQADQEIALQLNKDLEPLEFVKNSEIVYSIDMKSGRINFGDKMYDFSEPVYPYNIAMLLYAFVDWNVSEKESMLLLRPGRKSCVISTASVKKISNDEFKVSIDMYYDEIELYIRNGIPVKYVLNEDETFELIDY